ncbi:MAG: pyuvate ferredoxin oxidoreductase subunit delta [Candidatus Latescibacteria bacterium ADurb.Bin168]|nr:MAG: pyuvate ferredoxin oxidoreductase subunit delta [Candidatus Latescibacteria bacterium ADurb.Bin168]
MYTINYDLCTRCFACVKACKRPGALEIREGKPKINFVLCTECGLCAEACQHGAITKWEAREEDAQPPEVPVASSPPPVSAPAGNPLSRGFARCGAWIRSACGRRGAPRGYRRGGRWRV